MQKDLMRYLAGEVNSVRTDVIIGREKAPHGDFIVITPPEIGKPLYTFWQGNKSKKKKGKPRHTGGKPSYVKLYLQQLDKCVEDGMSVVGMGACMCLAHHLEWDTNMLVVGWGDRKRLMTRDDMAKLLKMSTRSVQNIITELKKFGILERDGKGYKFVGLLQKGGRSDENQV